MGIVETGLMWATHYRFTNDTTEISLGENAIQRVVDAVADGAEGALRDMFKRVSLWHTVASLPRVTPIYIASFVQRDEGAADDLIHWRSYGAHGDGYAIRLENIPIPDAQVPTAQSGAMLVRCMYDVDKFEALARRQLTRIGERGVPFAAKHGAPAQRLADASLMRQAGALLPRLKHRSFESEREWRYVLAPFGQNDVRQPGSAAKFRNTKKGIIPYIEFPLHGPREKRLPLTKVVVGPSRDQERRVDAVRLLLAKYDMNPEIVEAATIPFRG